MGNVWQDVRFALRGLRRSPAFTSVAVLTLALGIGATTAVFTVIKNVIFDPLPFEDPDRLVMIFEQNQSQNIARDMPSPPNYSDWLAQNRTFEDIAAMSDDAVTLSGVDQPTVVQIALVTPNTFSVLSVDAQRGRTFNPDDAGLPDDDDVTGASLALISDGLWKSAFGSQPDVVGRTLILNDTPRSSRR